MLRLFSLFVGLTVGNFVWQAATDHNWHVAFDRSYWQATACIAMAILAWFDDRFLGAA